MIEMYDDNSDGPTDAQRAEARASSLRAHGLTETTVVKMNPWKPDDNPHQARRIGKTGEEVNELGAVLARISIQGMDSIDPSSGKTNRQRFLEETADVLAQCEVNMDTIFTQVELSFIYERTLKKRRQMVEWEEHFK
jgi:hypothetical protein